MTPEQLMAALREPFPAESIGWKPGATSGNRALAMPFIDARDVMDRLDAVFGLTGWQDEYLPCPDGTAVCTLRVRIGGEWISHQDVGGASDQPDEGDRRKSSFSDALKRAAVKLGIGRYLYALSPIWCDWDQQRKRFATEPQLPASALPGHKPAKSAAPTNGSKKPPQPADGAELETRLLAFDAALSGKGLCRPGDLLAHVKTHGIAAGYVPELVRWPAPAIKWAVEEARAFEQRCKAGEGPVHAGSKER